MKELSNFYNLLKSIVSNRGREFSYADFFKHSTSQQACKLANQVLSKSTLLSVSAGQRDDENPGELPMYSGKFHKSEDAEPGEGYKVLQEG